MSQKVFEKIEMPQVKNIIVIASGKGGVAAKNWPVSSVPVCSEKFRLYLKLTMFLTKGLPFTTSPIKRLSRRLKKYRIIFMN